MANEAFERFAIGGLENNILGPDIASAATVAVTHRYHRVTGTAAIETISLPWAGFQGEVVLIPLGLFTLGTGGNIAPALSAVVGSPVVLHYDGLKWRPESSGAATILSPPVYEQSTTTNDGIEDTFEFTDPIVTLITAYVGGVAQLPDDCTVVGGDLVLADPPDAGAGGVVTALYFD